MSLNHKISSIFWIRHRLACFSSRRRDKQRSTSQENMISSDPSGTTSGTTHRHRGVEQRDTSGRPHPIAPVPTGISTSSIQRAIVSSESDLPQSGAPEPIYIPAGNKFPNADGLKITNMANSSKNILAVASTYVIQLWYLFTGKEMRTISCILPSSTISGLAFSPDGTSLAAVSLVPKKMGRLEPTSYTQ